MPAGNDLCILPLITEIALPLANCRSLPATTPSPALAAIAMTAALMCGSLPSSGATGLSGISAHAASTLSLLNMLEVAVSSACSGGALSSSLLAFGFAAPTCDANATAWCVVVASLNALPSWTARLSSAILATLSPAGSRASAPCVIF